MAKLFMGWYFIADLKCSQCSDLWFLQTKTGRVPTEQYLRKRPNEDAEESVSVLAKMINSTLL